MALVFTVGGAGQKKHKACNTATKKSFAASLSLWYKTSIQDVKASNSARVWDLRPVVYRSLGMAREGPKLYGFIAKEVAEVNPRRVRVRVLCLIPYRTQHDAFSRRRALHLA